MRKRYKNKLIYSIVSLLLIASVLVLATFERTHSGFTVFRKDFFSGTRSGNYALELYWSATPGAATWNNVETSGDIVPLDNNVLWEPDHSEVRYFRIVNSSNVPFNYNLGIDVPDDEAGNVNYLAQHPIAEAINVKVCRNINNLSVDNEDIGTLDECFQNPNILNVTTGDDLQLAAGESIDYALVFTMDHDAGNEYQGANLESQNASKDIGFKIRASASGNEQAEEPEFDGDFPIVLPHVDDYLYRVGNTNNIPVSALFDINESSTPSTNSLFAIAAFADAEFDSSKLSFSFVSHPDTPGVGCVFTPGNGTYSTIDEFLRASKFKFSGVGVITVNMLYNGQIKNALNLEVVNGQNVYRLTYTDGNNNEVAYATSNYNSSSNNILLSDYTATGQASLSGGRLLYGNGYTYRSNRASTKGTSGYLTITNGTVDNCILNGEVYDTAVTSGVENECYAPGVRIQGNAYIYNSYISECKYAVAIESGKVILENTTVTGGALANIYISGGNVTLENCSTSTTERGGLKGLGIQVASANCKVNLNGTFTQYNWLQKSEIPSSYSSFVNDVYNDSTFAYTTGGKTYVNMGLMFLNMAGNLTQTDAQSVISDSTTNSYGYKQKTAMSITGTLYTAKSSMGSAGMLSYPGYSVLDNRQYLTQPTYSFDFTTKNYIEKVTGNNNYCYYDSTTDTVNISFDKTDPSSAFNWDPMIFSAQKYGSAISTYTVTMNGTDYTGSMISFSETGSYQVVYTYNDLNQYYYTDTTDLYKETVTYTQTVNISVTAVEPDVQIPYADFVYVSSWANSAKKVIINNNTYVMPDVSATSSTIGSTTVGGQTVYYPIVSVGPTSNNGNTAYSSGKGYYFAPVFNAINITDYYQDTGAQQYTYTASSTTWPHGNAKATGPNTAYFGYAYEEKTFNNYSPYARSTNSQYYGYGSNNYGLCYTTNEIEKDNTASTHLVQYHYVSNDGTTYYYYIQYSFAAMTYSAGSCLAEGAQITMADGTQKPIEEVTYNDSILTYNFFTGETEEKNIAILVNHGKDYYKVLNLEFKDGTILRLIGDHGVFDYTLNEYVYMTEDNCKEYIGHKFVRFNEDGKYKKVKLADVSITDEYTTAYSITSAQNSNAMAENMLTVAPPDKFYNWIDMGGKMRYDKKQFDADVAKYGTYDYSVFEDYVSYEIYEAFNGPYLKVAVEKGKFTFKDIIDLINLYGSYMK